MVIGNVAGMAKQSMGEAAFIAVAIMAVGNAGGRVVAGILSDKIGRSNTLLIMLVFQALLMAACIPIVGSENTSALLLVILATFIGFNYGTNLSLFASFSKDMWGLKNFGINYGLLFTAWGCGWFRDEQAFSDGHGCNRQFLFFLHGCGYTAGCWSHVYLDAQAQSCWRTPCGCHVSACSWCYHG